MFYILYTAAIPVIVFLAEKTLIGVMHSLIHAIAERT